MYKVFIVDNEIAVRETLRNNFKWEDNDFVLVGEAPDGEIALPMIRDEKPDILITDIRMPFMDGIALCRDVLREMPWLQVVILSSFDDIDYVKQAFSLGVQEFLLKPVSAEELKPVLNRLHQRLEKERKESQNMEQLRRELLIGKQFVLNQVISNVIFSDITEAEEKKILAQMRAFRVNLISPCYTVINFRVVDGIGRYGEMHIKLIHVLERYCNTVFLCSGKMFLNALVLGDNRKDIEERAFSFAQSVLTTLDRLGYSDSIATIGRTVSSFREISSSYRSVRRHLVEKNHLPLRMRRITNAEDVQETQRTEANALEAQSLYDCLKYADLLNLDEKFTIYVDGLRTMAAFIPLNANYLFCETLLVAYRIIQQSGGDPLKLIDVHCFDENMNDHDLETCIPVALSILTQAISFRESKRTFKGKPMLNKALYFIEKNFSNPNLTFQDVLDHISMSSSHFSTLFSQTIGITFTNYLTNLRMQKAQELLLNTSMRSSEIAYAVGYNDPHYFSYQFKKKTDMTPSEFRSSKLSKPEYAPASWSNSEGEDH